MATADKILSFLARSSDCPPTAREIAEGIGASRPAVAAALRALEHRGAVTRAGVASDGGRTWTLRREM